MASTQYRAARTYEADRLPRIVSFGGEYSFDKADDMATTLDRLFHTGCEIGGLASQVDDNGIEVTGCYDSGYWEFRWDDPSQGVSRAIRWVPVDDSPKAI